MMGDGRPGSVIGVLVLLQSLWYEETKCMPLVFLCSMTRPDWCRVCEVRLYSIGISWRLMLIEGDVTMMFPSSTYRWQ